MATYYDVLCCWAKTLLALPAGEAAPAHLSCAAERCALGRCRRRDGSGTGGGGGGRVRDEAERRLDDLIRAVAVDPPDAADLTSMMLSRLEAAGLLPGMAVSPASKVGRQ